MLKMLHGKAKDEQWNNQIKEKLSPSLQEEIPFQDAAWPLPFVPGLEYNSPAHGTWNIVHMGMLLPGSHQIYVCGANCNRGVILTAAIFFTNCRRSHPLFFYLRFVCIILWDATWPIFMIR